MTKHPSIRQSLARAVHLRGSGVAVIDGEKRFTWLAFEDRVARLAGAFRAARLSEGGRVVLLSLNSHRSLEAFYAAVRAGGVIVPINHRLSEVELLAQTADCAPEIVLLGEGFTDYAARFAEIAPVRATFFAADGVPPSGLRDWEAEIAAAAPLEDAGRGGDDLACLLYTSGTTSAAKGVMLSHANIAANTLQTAGPLNFSERTVHLHHGPLFHVASSARVWTTTWVGGTHVVLPRFVASKVIAEIARTGITHGTFVSTMFRAMLDEPSLGTTNLSSLDVVSYGSSSMPEAILDEMMAALPNVRFAQAYGMTELSPVVTLLGPEDHLPHRRPSGVQRSAGQPSMLAEVRVVGPDDQPLPQGQAGEIVARGPMVMLGYWNRPDLTAEALRGGWMHTGDIGYFDAEGYLYVVDRLKDMIITGGENVWSQEVENVLSLHPAVSQCAVFGVPDPRWTEAVNAAVTLKPGASVTPAELIAHCRDRLAHYKCPRALEIRETMPLSGANKILKTALRDEAARRGEHR